MLEGARRTAVRRSWLAPAALVLAQASAGAAGLWGDGNLLARPPIAAGESVTVVLDHDRSRPSAAPSPPGGVRAEEGRCGPRGLAVMTARVVKVLPDGRLVLEARVSVGDGYVLLGGEVARADVDARRRTRVSRLARLAVVARGLDARALGPVLGAAAERGQ